MVSTLNYLDVDMRRISFEQWKEVLLFQYNNDRCFVQSPFIELTHYGIPNKDKYHETDESRMYIKIPIL